MTDAFIASITGFVTIFFGVYFMRGQRDKGAVVGNENSFRGKWRTIGEKLSLRTTGYIILEKQNWEGVSRSSQFGKLAEGIFHTFTNRLSVLIMYFERTEERSSKNEEQARGVREMALHMNTFISSVRGLIHGSDGESTKTATLSESFQVMQDLYGHELRAKKIRMTIRHEHDVRVPIHPAALNGILMDIISNSIESFEGFQRYARFIRISTRIFQKGGFVKIEISDNGCGMDQDNVSKAGKHSFTTKKDGTGTGLISASRVAHGCMGGSLDVTSTKSKGTTVSITLPTINPDLSNL